MKRNSAGGKASSQKTRRSVGPGSVRVRQKGKKNRGAANHVGGNVEGQSEKHHGHGKISVPLSRVRRRRTERPNMCADGEGCPSGWEKETGVAHGENVTPDGGEGKKSTTHK